MVSELIDIGDWGKQIVPTRILHNYNLVTSPCIWFKVKKDGSALLLLSKQLWEKLENTRYVRVYENKGMIRIVASPDDRYGAFLVTKTDKRSGIGQFNCPKLLPYLHVALLKRYLGVEIQPGTFEFEFESEIH